MIDHLRSIALTVSESGDGVFHWVLLERTADSGVFKELRVSEETFDSWSHALVAGTAELQGMAAEQVSGPRIPGEDEDSDPVG